MVKVSVIIPAYNAEKYIREAVDSVLNQTFKDFEIIVIDDGSTDSTPEILKSYGNKIRWKSQENKGQASARNGGIKMAKGKYIAYLDADDVCLPERLEIQINYLDSHPDVGLVYSDYYQMDENKKIIRTKKSQIFDYLSFLKINYIGASTVMHKRACINKVGLFDEGFTTAQDWDLWIRISEKFGMGYINKPLIKYRLHKGSVLSKILNKKDHEINTRIKILKKTYKRRGKPFWMKIQIIRTIVIGKLELETIKIKETLRKVHPVCRKFASAVLIALEAVDNVLYSIEKNFMKGIKNL